LLFLKISAKAIILFFIVCKSAILNIIEFSWNKDKKEKGHISASLCWSVLVASLYNLG